MCLEFKKPKEKNKSFTCTLTCSKQCTRDVFITDWNKNSKRRLINVFTFLQDQEKLTVDEFSR